jgi:hypothetical protein
MFSARNKKEATVTDTASGSGAPERWDGTLVFYIEMCFELSVNYYV